jgi:hypothetical protein
MCTKIGLSLPRSGHELASITPVPDRLCLLLAGVVRGGNEDGTVEDLSQPETESRVSFVLNIAPKKPSPAPTGAQ